MAKVKAATTRVQKNVSVVELQGSYESFEERLIFREENINPNIRVLFKKKIVGTGQMVLDLGRSVIQSTILAKIKGHKTSKDAPKVKTVTIPARSEMNDKEAAVNSL